MYLLSVFARAMQYSYISRRLEQEKHLIKFEIYILEHIKFNYSCGFSLHKFKASTNISYAKIYFSKLHIIKE